VPDAEIRLAIAPLFSGRAVFSTLILSRPRILFRKYADGTHSATDIANRLAAAEPPAAPAGRADKVAVAVRSVAIEDAALSLRFEEPDGRETKWDISPFTFRLAGIGTRRNAFEIATRVDGAVRGEISFRGSATRARGAVSDPTVFDIEGTGSLFGQPVTAAGTMSAPSGAAEIDLAVDLPRIRMDRIPDLFAEPPAALRDARPEGVAAMAVKVSGNLQTMGFEIDADLTRAGWTVTPDIRKFIDAPCTVVVQGHRFPDVVVVSNAEFRYQPLLLIANATYAPATGVHEWAASARISSLAEFARSRGTDLARYAPTGRLTASGRGRKASAAEPDVYAVAVDLGDVGLQIPAKRLDLRALDGHVELSPKAVSFSPLTGLVNGQRFTLRGNATLGASPTGQADLRMDYLDLDALLPPGKPGAGDAEAGRAKPAAPGRTRREFSARATVEIGAGKARGIEFRDLAGSVRYEKGVLELDSVRAALYGGEATLSGRIVLSGPAPDFAVKVALREIRAEQLLSRKTSLGDVLSGPVSLAADVRGGATDFADFARTASGAGSIRVAGGKIRGVDLLSTAAGMAGLSGVLPAAPRTAGGAAGETAFSDLSADFRIKGGKIRSDAVALVSDKIGLSGAAVIGFDKTLDFRGVLRLSKEMSDRVRGGAGRYLVGPGGRVEIPLVMSGPVSAPAVAIDTDALARGIAGGLVRGLTERIPGAAAAPDNAAPAGEERAREGAGPARGVEDLLRRFLPGR
ncbi:MAG: AsmA-like C-terminal region-containing protein, partial [Gemmatimonadota bacterium]